MPDLSIQGGGPSPLFQNLDIKTLEGAKQLYADVVRHYAEGTINESNARTLVYLLSNFLPFLKFEKDMQIDQEIERIKERLEALGK